VAETVIVLGAVATALGAVWKFLVVPIAKGIRVLHLTYEKVSGYDDRLAVVEERSAQLVNNSGSSMKDAVDRIEAKQDAQASALADHIDNERAELLKVWQALATTK
jgi:hypothetical protein